MKPIIYMLCGLPGSGKTTYSLELQRKTGFKRFSLDEEYFKIVGNKQQKERDFRLEKQIDSKLKEKIARLIKNGESLILDYCPWQKKQREKDRKFIESHGGIRNLVYFSVSLDELKHRTKRRNKQKYEHNQFVTSSMLNDFVARFEAPENEGEEIVAP